MEVGFIGLGAMGRVMATNLINAGHSVRVWNRSPAPVDALIVDQRFEPAGFALRLGLKDTRLALAAGEDAHVALPFGSVLRDNFLDAIAHGDADRDWTAVANVALRRAGLAATETRSV